MKKLYFVFALVLITATSGTSRQVDSLQIALAFEKFEEAKACFKKEKERKHKKCASKLQEAYELSYQHGYFLKEAVNFLIGIESYKLAHIYLSRVRYDTLSHAAQSQYFYFKGVLDIKKGCAYYDDAFQSFECALSHEKQSAMPNALHLSKVYNALGFTRMTYGTNNRLPEEKDNEAHCNWITADIKDALRYFKYSEFYNADNEDAIANRDSLLSKIEMAEIDICYDDIAIDGLTNISQDTMVIDFFENEQEVSDTLKEINLSYLPGNYKHISKVLNKYDEVTVISDISGSMLEIHPVKEVTRFAMMKEIVLYLAHALDEKIALGINTVGGWCYDDPALNIRVGSQSRSTLYNMVASLYSTGLTPLINSLLDAKSLFSTANNNKALLIISDGMDTCSANPLDLCLLAEDLYAYGIDIHIVSFIMEGADEYDYAYGIYNCMIQSSNGTLHEINEEGNLDDKSEETEEFGHSLILPKIKVGKILKMKYLEVFQTSDCG